MSRDLIQTTTPRACNDNGVFSVVWRGRRGANILQVAAHLAGSISLHFLIEGVLIIRREDTRERQTA